MLYGVNLNPTVGAEIKKQRPCVIISHSSINEVRRTVVVVPLSTSSQSHPPITINLHCQGNLVVAVCDQVRAVDKIRLVNYIEDLSFQDLQKLEINLKKVLVL